MKTKKCVCCGKRRSLDKFTKRKASDDGHHYYCRECQRAHNKKTYEKHRESRVQRELDKYHNDPEFREKKLAYMREWQKGNTRKRREYLLEHKYGITHEQYDELLAKQGGVCAICGQPERSERYKRLCVDHCHDKGYVRGLLCSNCNRAIGLIADCDETLRRAAHYILESPGRAIEPMKALQRRKNHNVTKKRT